MRSIHQRTFFIACVVGSAACLSLPIVRNSEWAFLLVLLFLLGLSACGVLFLRGRWRDFSLLCSSLIFITLPFEGLGLWRQHHPIHIIEGLDGYFGNNAVLGYAPAKAGRFLAKKKNRETGDIVYEAEYTIDENLLRKTSGSGSGPIIAFLGDSFTFGEGVNDADTLPQAFADLESGGSRVLNFGFSTYGPQQFLRAMETGVYDRLLRNQDLRLFVFQTAPWHADRTACRPDWVKTGPSYRLVEDDVAFAGTCSHGFWNRLRRAAEASAFYREFVFPIIDEKVSRSDIELYIAVGTKSGKVSSAAIWCTDANNLSRI